MLTLMDIPGWLNVFVAAGGAVLSGLNLARSRWAPILLGGFLAEAIAAVFFRVATLGIRSGALQMSRVGVAFSVAYVLASIGHGTVVAGLAGIFSDLRTNRVPSGPRM